MTLPNADEPLSNPGGEQNPEDGGQKAEDRGPTSEPVSPAPSEVCPPSAESHRPSFVIRLLSFVRRLPRPVVWSGCGAAAVFCLVGAIVLLRGCEGRVTTRPTPQMGIESRFWIRVLLLNNVAECTIDVPSAFRVTSAEPESRIATGEPALEPLMEPARISLVDGRLRLGTTPLAGKEAILSPEPPCIFGLNGQKYRGRLKLIVSPDGRSLDAVNLVPLEPYLAGVVGGEMPYHWEPEALKAQAIAARTYCLFNKIRFGANRTYDVKRTQSSQVYGGISAESAQVWDAVNSTCGQVLIAPGLMETWSRGGIRPASGIPGLFPAYYSSTCGGHTSSSEEVFGDSYGPLKGVECPYCKNVAKLEDFCWPTATFDRDTVMKQLVDRYPKVAALGEITDVTATEESCYGLFSRLRRIRLTGTNGKTDTLRAEDLRLAIDHSGRKIKSAMCRIIPWGSGWAFVSGRGWGHGVGMCQCGAQGMARLGSDAESILGYYYPGAQIINLY